MAGYLDTKKLIIDTLMGRPAGTQIMPEDHQTFALSLLDYIHSVELIGASALQGIATTSTIPVQPDNAKVSYIATVPAGQTYVFTNFHDQNGNSISITTGANTVSLLTFLWNGEYWQVQNNQVQLMLNITAGYLYAGIAIPTTNPGNPDEPVFYIAVQAGTYSNFGGITVNDGEAAILKYVNSSWVKEVSGLATREEVNDSILKLSNIGGEIYFEKLNSRFAYCPKVIENTSEKLLMSDIPLQEGVTYSVKVNLSHNSDGVRLWLFATGYNPAAMVMTAGTLSQTFTFTPSANYNDGKISIRLSGGAPTPTDAIVEISYPQTSLDAYPIMNSENGIKSGGVEAQNMDTQSAIANAYIEETGKAVAFIRYAGTGFVNLMSLPFVEGREYNVTLERENEDCGRVRCWIENDVWHPTPSSIDLTSGLSISQKITPISNQVATILIRCAALASTMVKVTIEANVLNDYKYIRRQEINRVYHDAFPYSVGTIGNSPSYYDRQHKCLALVVSSDSHIDYYLSNAPFSKKNVGEMVDFVNHSKLELAAIINCGDSVTTSGTSWTKALAKARIAPFFEMGMESNIPFLYTKGNHDCNDMLNLVVNVYDDADWQGIYFGDAETKYGIVRQLKSNGQKSTWYYYDIPNYKVRIVAVDVQDAPKWIGDPADNTMCFYTGSLCFYISNEQMNWIAGTALNFDDKDEKDWGVIIISHQDTVWERDGVKYGSNVSPSKYNMVSSIPKFYELLAAFNQQGTYSDSYSFDPDETGSSDVATNPFAFFNLSINANFTRYAALDKKPYVIASLLGHEHVAMNKVENGINKIWFLNQMCSDHSSDSRVARVPETDTQNSFDILIVDTENRKIRTIRYGAGDDCYGNKGNRFLPDGLSY